MANVITRLLMDSSNYTKGLESAQKSLDKYIDKNMTVGNVVGNVTGIIAKLAAGVGVAMGAQEAFNRVIQGSQTTGDEYARIMRSVNTVMDSFFTSISTGDFTAFNNGLDALITKARDANDALDQLGNTTMSYDYFNSKNQADFAEQIVVLRDNSATQAAKDAAKKRIEEILKDQKEITDQYAKRSMEAIGALVVEGNSLNVNQISRESIDKVLRLDVSSAGAEEKEQLAKRYQEYVNEYNRLKKKHTSTSMMFTSAGAVTQDVTDYKKLEDAMQSVNEKYLDAVTYNEVLVRKNDQWLQSLIKIASGADNASRAFYGMEKTYNRALGSRIGGGGSGKTKAKTPFEETKWTNQTIDQKIKLAIFKTSDNVLSNEIYKAIEDKKQLPILIQPVKTSIEMEDAETEAMENDPVLEALQSRMSMYNLAESKIQEYQNLLAVANDEEKGYLEEQIAIWERYRKSIGSVVKEGNDLSQISGALGTMGSALQSTGNDWVGMLGSALSVAGSLIQVIQTLTAAEAANAVAKQASSSPFPYNLIAIAGTLAAMTSAISSVKSFGNFAEGGVIGGTNYQDGITARVSSGEMFINEADQKRLYDAIHTGNLGGSGGRAIVDGEKIVMVINNYGKRSGRGEILKL